MRIRNFVSLMIAVSLCAIAGASMAGDVRGPQEWRGLVRPGQLVKVGFILRGDETTRIHVNGDGDGDIDCVLQDENGGVVDKDLDETDTCLVRVTPMRTGDFTLVVKNNGRVSSAVRASTN